MFSWTNVYDLSGPQGGTAVRLRELLRLIGPRWVALEMNPWKVIRKEVGDDPSDGTPAFSESFIKAYYPQIADGPLDLATVVDLIQADRATVQAELQKLKDVAVEKFRHHRERYRADQRTLEEDLPEVQYVEGRPAAFVVRALERLITRELGYQWTPNDGVDFMHAAVGAAYADLILVDRQWKRRVLAAAPARDYPWVFYRAELDSFLEAFDQLRVAGA
jgi:hypothetical protein